MKVFSVDRRVMMALGEGAGDGGSGAGGGASGGSGGQGSGASSGAAAGNAGAGANSNAGAAGGNAGQANAAAGSPNAGAGGIGDGGKGAAASWRDALPEEMRSDPTLNKYSDLQNLARAHVELQKKIGEKGIFKPKPDASKEEIAAFREALGIPTDATKYDLGKFDDSLKVDEATVNWAKKVGAENGIEPAAMKAIIADYMKVSADNVAIRGQVAKDEIKKGFDGLRTEWGDAFDRNLNRANFAAEKLGGKPLVDALKKFGADNDPFILKAFAEAAKLFGEDRLREAGAGNGGQSPQELDAEMRQVQGQLMGLTKEDGRRPALLARWESLNKQKTAGK